MDEINLISACYKKLFGNSDLKITALARSGSDRKYFRIASGDKTVIGAYNKNFEENEAFIGFTQHFISKGFPYLRYLGIFPINLFIFFRIWGI